MTESWPKEEFGTINLVDKRLNKRVMNLAETLGDKPGANIPGACENWAEMAAAYRLLANENVSSSDLLEAHARRVGRIVSARHNRAEF